MKDFIYKILKWLRSVASEVDGTGSMKRVIAFMLGSTYCYNAIHAQRTGKVFDHFTQQAIAFMLLLLLGLATAPQIMQALTTLRGWTPPKASPTPPMEGLQSNEANIVVDNEPK